MGSGFWVQVRRRFFRLTCLCHAARDQSVVPGFRSERGICFVLLLQTGLALVSFRVNLPGSRHGVRVVRERPKEFFLIISEVPAVFMMHHLPYV